MRFNSLFARFSGVVFPGETILVRCWDDGPAVRLMATAKDRNVVMLDEGLLEREV